MELMRHLPTSLAGDVPAAAFAGAKPRRLLPFVIEAGAYDVVRNASVTRTNASADTSSSMAARSSAA